MVLEIEFNGKYFFSPLQWLNAHWEGFHFVHKEGQCVDLPFPVQDIP